MSNQSSNFQGEMQAARNREREGEAKINCIIELSILT